MLPESYAIVNGQIAPCGLHCERCNLGNGSVAESAIILANHLKQYDVASWASQVPGGSEIDFKMLDQSLAWVSKSINCPGCIKGGGNPDCPIRICSKERGLSSCGQCSGLADCDKFDWLGEGGKGLKIELGAKASR